MKQLAWPDPDSAIEMNDSDLFIVKAPYLQPAAPAALRSDPIQLNDRFHTFHCEPGSAKTEG